MSSWFTSANPVSSHRNRRPKKSVMFSETKSTPQFPSFEKDKTDESCSSDKSCNSEIERRENADETESISVIAESDQTYSLDVSTESEDIFAREVQEKEGEEELKLAEEETELKIAKEAAQAQQNTTTTEDENQSKRKSISEEEEEERKNEEVEDLLRQLAELKKRVDNPWHIEAKNVSLAKKLGAGACGEVWFFLKMLFFLI